MKVTFDREGAVIVGTEMTLIPRQADWTEVGLAGLILDRKPAENLGNVDLLEITKNRTYVAQSGPRRRQLPESQGSVQARQPEAQHGRRRQA